MKFSCNTKELSDACNNVMRAVSTKVTIPAIEGILIKAQGESIYLTGYDFEFGIHTILSARVAEEGSVILNAKIFCDIIRRLGEERVEIEVNDRLNTTITSGAAQYSILGIDADEYPELPSVTGGVPVILNQELLTNMVSQTLFAVAEGENAKPIHTGLRFEIVKGGIRLIGVDGFRLAMRTETIAYEGEDIAFVVPKKTIRELTKLMSGGDENVAINVGRRHIVFEVGNYSIISRLLDGEFLNYNDVIPKTTETSVLVNTREAINCIEKTLPVIDNNTKNPIRCIFDHDMLRVSAVTVLGKVVDTCHANVSGERVEIGFNSKYILDALHTCDADEIMVELVSPTSPVKIVPIQGDGFLFLVLPVRLKRNEN